MLKLGMFKALYGRFFFSHVVAQYPQKLNKIYQTLKSEVFYFFMKNGLMKDIFLCNCSIKLQMLSSSKN